MPYSPPAYNAVVFNFTVSGYLPAAYNAVVFNFGSVPLPPAGSISNLRARFAADDEPDLPTLSRRFAFVSSAPPPAAIFPVIRRQLVEPEEEPWRPPWRPHRAFARIIGLGDDGQTNAIW